MLRVKIVASLAWEGEKRRPEIRLRFTGYVQRLELWAMWTKLLKTGFNNIEMSKDFNNIITCHHMCFLGRTTTMVP